MGKKPLLMILSTVFLLGWAGLDDLRAQEGPSLVVHFENGQSFLSQSDKSFIRDLFRRYEVGPKSRVFILGYTDARGDATSNYRLSRKRAQSVRREIISSFGIEATIVMSMGKGEENPVADNGSAKGRALNRRAEIYLANARVRQPARIYGPEDPYLPAIQNLVREAEAFIKQDRLNEAIRALDKARPMGGDHYSDWHAAYGIAGYYAQAPDDDIEAHLLAAIELDKYNFRAREYLSRMQARQMVAKGQVTPLMGLTAETAIAVNAVAQEYEYLRLFDVRPVYHYELENKPVDVWECFDANGYPTVYYFNHSGTYTWAFAHQTKPAPARSAAMPATQVKVPTIDPMTESASQDQEITEQPTEDAPEPQPRQIWESRVFQ